MLKAESTPAYVYWSIGGVSLGAVSLIAFLLMRDAHGIGRDAFMWLPGANALCNAIATLCLIQGYRAIRQARRERHRNWMLAACSASSLFLAGYLLHHYLHGDTKLVAHGAVRAFYLAILASHVLLSMIVFPCILFVLYWALTQSFVMHKRLARWVYPAWLYVSVTGVLIFALQKWLV